MYVVLDFEELNTNIVICLPLKLLQYMCCLGKPTKQVYVNIPECVYNQLHCIVHIGMPFLLCLTVSNYNIYVYRIC